MFLLNLRIILFCVLLLSLTGCSTYELAWRKKAQVTMQQLERDDAQKMMPDAYLSVKETFQQGEEILRQEDDELADIQYQMAYQKAEILKVELKEYKALLAEEALRKTAEENALRLEAEQKRQEALADAEDEKRKKEIAARNKGKGAENGSHSSRERLALSLSHTVRRGETLPQIAARPEVYNDSSLWQIIYKANRDQVRDPFQLWPGQVLKIPRSNSSR